MTFKDRLEEVRARVSRAAARSGRRPEDVTLVAVTKGTDLDGVREAFEAGLRIFGENRVQEALSKAPALDAEWHLIGHLQTNKVKAALPLFRLVQSVDSERLVRALSGAALAEGRRLDVLIEVNVSGDAAKHGFDLARLPAELEPLFDLPGIRVRGLMGMAPLEGGERAAREAFAKLRTLRDALAAQKDVRYEMKHLSMGMSGDFEAAIEEGSSMVRIGRALFS